MIPSLRASISRHFALAALRLPDGLHLSKLYHSCHSLELKPIHANWASAGLWLVYLAGRRKTEASCQLLFAQAARFPRACQHGDPMKGLCAKQLLCFLRDYHRGWRDYLALQPALPYLHTITTTAPPALGGTASDSRGQPPYEDRRWDSSWSQKKASEEDDICVCAALCKVVLTPLYVSEQASHPSPLLFLGCDHIATLGHKKAFSSVTELFYYLKCYLNLTIKYSCEFMPVEAKQCSFTEVVIVKFHLET